MRIWPSYAIALLIWWKIIPLLGNGPLWQEFTNNESANCNNKWWTNLLFVDNFC